MADDSNTARDNRRWADIIVRTCVENGVNAFFLASGSRCTPLVTSVAAASELAIVRHFDERGLAFAALGYGRGTCQPGVLITTSGTAVANALPAVVEAFQVQVPMLLLTADRPPELRDAGANQTIDQSHIFGRYTRWFVDLPCPTAQIDDSYVRSTLNHAVRMARLGPVHVNCMFREPFGGWAGTADVDVMGAGRTECDPAAKRPADRRVKQCEHDIPERIRIPGGKTLVMVGAGTPDQVPCARELAERISAPFLSDISTGQRPLAYELALMTGNLPRPDTVLHIGGRVVSKRWLQFVSSDPRIQIVRISSGDDRIDPLHRLTEHWHGHVPSICQAIELDVPSPVEFRDAWHEVAAAALETVASLLDGNAMITEPGIAWAIASLIKSGSGLFLGNSMPVRDMDTFGFWTEERSIRVGVNRGASGIDGLVGSAAGYALGIGAPVTLLLGDISLLHDLNSLALLRDARQPVIVVVVNNRGGGIFHFLPIAREGCEFEQFFAAAHDMDFRMAAGQFHLPYYYARSIPEFVEAYRRAQDDRRSQLIEVETDRWENLRFHRQIEAQLRKT